MKTLILAFMFYFAFSASCCNNNKQIYASEEWTEEKEGEIYDSCRCGLPLKVDLERGGPAFKMMGGNEVEEGTMPWAVAIFKKDENGEEGYACTGTLVSKKHVLTAAHCFMKPAAEEENDFGCKSDCCNAGDGIGQNELGEQISVYIGSVCLTKVKSFGRCNSAAGREQRKFGVKKGSYEHYFRAKCNFQDYSILELEEEVPTKIANHICLLHLHSATSKNAGMIGKPVKALGWGLDVIRQQNGEEIPVKNLQILEMTEGIWPEEKCRNAVINELKLPFYEDMLCTEEKIDFDVCKGDSGGGLIAKLNLTNNGNDDEKRWFLIGVVSFGQDCQEMQQGNQQPIAQVYTSVFTNRTQISGWMGTQHLSRKLFKSPNEKKCEEMINLDGDKEIWDWEEECSCEGFDDDD